MRLFVAVTLPSDVREQLGSLGSGLPGARWVAPENMHLTLRFVGEVDKHVAGDVDDMLSGISCSGFELTLQGVGTFTEGRKIKAIWVGVQGNETLSRLQAKVEQAVTRAGLPPEKRKFKPHVTLARFKSDPGQRLHDYLQAHALFRAGPIVIDTFALYSSILGHGGPHYAQEAVYPLEPATVGQV